MTRLRYERTARRQSQLALAREARLTQPALSMIERGVLIPTAEQLERLSEVFSIPPAELLKEVVVVEASRRVVQ